MSKKTNIGEEANDGTSKTKNKGDSEQSHQKGAPSVSKKANKHLRDESGGAEKNTTKKQQNSI
jgi:hypothetical protein